MWTFSDLSTAPKSGYDWTGNLLRCSYGAKIGLWLDLEPSQMFLRRQDRAMIGPWTFSDVPPAPRSGVEGISHRSIVTFFRTWRAQNYKTVCACPLCALHFVFEFEFESWTSKRDSTHEHTSRQSNATDVQYPLSSSLLSIVCVVRAAYP
jgi:hypothetical protein